MNKTIFLALSLLLVGCNTTNTPQPTYPKGTTKIKPDTPPKHPMSKPAPKKPFKMKEAQPTNYSSAYMYPEDTDAQPLTEQNASTVQNQPALMNKEECIAMIGQEKFDKYTQMFADENATLKRCTMMKALNSKQ